MSARAYRVTVLLPDRRRIVQTFLAQSQHQVHAAIDRDYPERLYAAVMQLRHLQRAPSAPHA